MFRKKNRSNAHPENHSTLREEEEGVTCEAAFIQNVISTTPISAHWPTTCAIDCSCRLGELVVKSKLTNVGGLAS